MQGGKSDSPTKVAIYNETYIYGVTLGDIAKAIPLTHEIFRKSPEHYKSPNKIP